MAGKSAMHVGVLPCMWIPGLARPRQTPQRNLSVLVVACIRSPIPSSKPAGCVRAVQHTGVRTRGVEEPAGGRRRHCLTGSSSPDWFDQAARSMLIGFLGRLARSAGQQLGRPRSGLDASFRSYV